MLLVRAQNLFVFIFAEEVIIPTLISNKENMYEPLHHKVDRVFYEARELKEDVNSEFYYQSNKERQLSSKRSEVNWNEENMNILANKLISSPEKSQVRILINFLF